MNEEVLLIPGGIAIDDRGAVQFCNDFAFDDVKRFYIVSNHEPRFVRAWHAHRREAKFAFAASGAAIFAAVKIDDWQNPSREAEVRRFVISAEKPAILKIPGGYAHGFMTLVPATRIIFFSTATLEESQGDDFRYDADYWNPWEVVPR